MKRCARFIVGFFSLALFSCGEKSDNPTPLKIAQIYKWGSGEGNGEQMVNMANHTIILTAFNDDYWSWQHLVDFADSYRDTAQSNLPIKSIDFCRPFAFDPVGDNRDWEDIEGHLIVSIDYSKQTMHKKLPDISGITFWKDGKPFTLNLLTKRRKMLLAGYYDSSGEYSDRWMDRYKNQVPVDHAVDSMINAQRP